MHPLRGHRPTGAPAAALALGSVLVAVIGVVASGCRTDIRSELARGSRGDGDLVALLPAGLDAVLDVDVAGLRQLDVAAQLVGYLPDSSLARLNLLSDDPLHNIEALAVGLYGIGSGELDVVLCARGGNGPEGYLERDRVFHGVRKLGRATEAEYHAVPLIETEAGQAAAMLTERTVVTGNRLRVRQAIDIFRGEEAGARRQAAMAQALERAPRGRDGRPAVLAALLLAPSLRDRMRQVGLPELSTDAEVLSMAFAVGDGIDLGVVAGFRELPLAEQAGVKLKERANSLKGRPALMFLGVDRFVQPLVAVAVAADKDKGRSMPELHLAYRLPGDELRELLVRLGKLQQLRQRQEKPSPGPTDGPATSRATGG